MGVSHYHLTYISCNALYQRRDPADPPSRADPDPGHAGLRLDRGPWDPGPRATGRGVESGRSRTRRNYYHLRAPDLCVRDYGRALGPSDGLPLL